MLQVSPGLAAGLVLRVSHDPPLGGPSPAVREGQDLAVLGTLASLLSSLGLLWLQHRKYILFLFISCAGFGIGHDISLLVLQPMRKGQTHLCAIEP